MKRILLVFLFLAIAGGLFAQVTWGGSVYAGLGLTKVGDDDLALGIWSSDIGSAVYRGQVNATYTNADGTAGGTVQLRAQGNSSNLAISSPVAYGWMTFQDGFLKVLGGRISNSELNAVDSWYGGSLYNTGWGLQTYLYPADEFKFGVGVKTGTGSNSNALSAGLKMDDLVGWLGLTADLDTFSANAQLSAQKDDVNAVLSAAFSGLDDFDLDAYAYFSGLTEFGDAGELDAGVYVGYSGVDKLYAYFDFNPIIPMASDEDMILIFSAGLEYEVSDVVTPGADVEFVLQGGEYDGLFSYDTTYNKDNSFLGISPWLKFAASSRASITLGYTLGVDMSKIAPSAGNKGGINHAAYINFAFTF
jgi:hypothetical protein